MNSTKLFTKKTLQKQSSCTELLEALAIVTVSWSSGSDGASAEVDGSDSEIMLNLYVVHKCTI